MYKLLCLVPFFLFACSHTPTSTKAKQNLSYQPKENVNVPDRIEVSHTLWKEMGYPVFDINAYQDKFYKHKIGRFEITEDLVYKADKFLFRLSKEDYARIFQRHTTPETMNVVHHKIMQKEYLYSNEGPFTLEVHADGEQSLVHRPQKNGFEVDFTTIFSANSEKNAYHINMIFHANQVYGKPKGLDQKSYSKRGQVLCCSSPSTLAAYEKTENLEFTMFSELIQFPYFKRTEVNKHLQNGMVVKVDSTIRILKFGIDRVLSVGDQKSYINGRLEQNFVNPQLQLDLEY